MTIKTQLHRPSSLPHPGSSECILLTGATGFLGRQILLTLIEKYPRARFILLVRPKRATSPEQRVASLVQRICSPEHRESVIHRIQIMGTDLGGDSFRLNGKEREQIVAQATRIIHTAATVRFDHPLEEARRINVGGVKNVLGLVDETHRRGCLRSFTHVSTAFVAGDRAGVANEADLELGQGFRNTYEQTKCEAERLVRDRMNDLPITIARPSIIVGDSRTGVTTSFKTLYWPLKVYAKGWWRTVPGHPDAVVDIVPVDFVAEAIAHLAFDPQARSKCLHLCAGPISNASIGEISDFAAAYFKQPSPRFVNPKLFWSLLKPSLNLFLWGRRRWVLKTGRVYGPYFSMRTVFDTHNAEELLSPAGITPPHVMVYLAKLFRYCIDTNWGSTLDKNRPVQ